ncbi:MAG: DUF3298 domain-containing protein [Bacteroidales bacterium]
MTKKAPFLLVVWIVFMSVIGSCTPKTQPLASNDIQFDSLASVDSQVIMLDTIAAKCKVKMMLDFPVKCSDKYDLKQLQELFIHAMIVSNMQVQSPEEAMLQYKDSCFNDFNMQIADLQKMLPNFKEDPPAFVTDFYHQKDVLPVFNKADFLSIASNFYDFTGGAHGYGAEIYKNYDLQTMKPIVLADIFAEENFEKVAELIVEQLVKDYHVESPQQLEETGFFNIKQIVPTENFCLTDSALLFSYTRYDIAPYSMGQINVEISYSQLKPFTKSNSVISRLYTK